MRKQYTRVQYNDKSQKQCTNCREYKETLKFHKYSKAQDGLKPWCKVCVKAYDIKEGDSTRIFPRKLNDQGQTHCRNCGQYFPEKEMHSGMTYCIECSPLLKRTRTLKKYGLSLDDYHRLLEDQNFKCKICKQKDITFRKRLSVDHDHACCPGEGSCGKCIRGLLCHHCNAALGNAKDSIETLQRMIEYLQK